ncbi:hypothetical protein EXE40_05520 [Halorubrum sp. GN11GM_10-3_MGM]|nr:hypothetical protein EXE40_05520 [Halorubrum sp. GN11GM_10-3_MGM]
MNDQAEISPAAIISVVVTTVSAGIVGMIGLAVISPFAARCDEPRPFVQECMGITLSVGSSIDALVGPLGLIILVISLFIALCLRLVVAITNYEQGNDPGCEKL